jgi:hypothetical protein
MSDGDTKKRVKEIAKMLMDRDIRTMHYHQAKDLLAELEVLVDMELMEIFHECPVCGANVSYLHDADACQRGEYDNTDAIIE